MDDLLSTTTSLLRDKNYKEAYSNQLRTVGLISHNLMSNIDPKSPLFPLAHSLLDDAQESARKTNSSSVNIPKVSIRIITTDVFTIPSIPISQHALDVIEKTKKLVLANDRYTNASIQGSPLIDLRRFLEDKRILESQVERLTKEIEYVAISNYGTTLLSYVQHTGDQRTWRVASLPSLPLYSSPSIRAMTSSVQFPSLHQE
jgi:hypothetical protein